MRRLFCLGMVVLAGCQVTDFEVRADGGFKAIAARNDIRMVVLVDRSVSTRLPVDPLDPACPISCGEAIRPDCPTGCRTRLSAALEGVERMLEVCRPRAEVAVAVFPGDGVCGEPAVVVPLGSRSPVEELRPRLREVRPSGGHAAGHALDWLGRSPWLARPIDHVFVGLLTTPLDGCDATPDGRCRAVPSPCDDLDPAAGATAMRMTGRSTWVIPMGGADQLDSSELERIALAGGTSLRNGLGGVPTPAVLAAECELLAAVERDMEPILCRHALPAKPPGSSLLLVTFEGRRVDGGPDTWMLDGTTLVLTGRACEAVRASTVTKRFHLGMRWVSSP